MITKVEWRQIIMALAHGVLGRADGSPIISLSTVTDILKTHAEQGCDVVFEPDGRMTIRIPITKEGE